VGKEPRERTMNEYEIAILFDPDLEIDIEKSTQKVEKIFIDNGGKIIKVDNWGKRKLAYPIKKHEAAIYSIYTLHFPPQSVIKVEKTLNITDEVIRFLITRPDLKAIVKAEAAKAEKLQRAAERGEDPRSDDSETEEE
jgi:small subunit ribosomal protein S6